MRGLPHRGFVSTDPTGEVIAALRAYEAETPGFLWYAPEAPWDVQRHPPESENLMRMTGWPEVTFEQAVAHQMSVQEYRTDEG